MRKSAFSALACLMLFVSGFAYANSSGDLVTDENLFQSIRDHYNGTWSTRNENHSGEVRFEALKSGSILLELNGSLAESVFYYLPKANEDIHYIPAKHKTPFGSSLNYFDRKGDGLACGFSSNDLKQDPFPRFKCRFSINVAGGAQAFLDRDDSSSSATSPSYGGKWHSWIHDFHIGVLDTVGGLGSVYGDTNSAEIAFSGDAAKQLYKMLTASEVDKPEPPNLVEVVKVGEKIRCARVKSDVEDPVSCFISFNPDGAARPAELR